MQFLKGLLTTTGKSSVTSGFPKSAAVANLTQIRTKKKKAAGSRTSNKDSAGRRLGPKAGDGEFVKTGQIIMRQRGTKIHPGENTGLGNDHTIFALEPGYVRFYYDPFHPLRKYVGVALTRDYKLPKDHFAPRLRRFGYEEILDEESRIREESNQSRKEYLMQPELEQQRQEFEEYKSKTLEEYKKAITNEFKLDLNEEEVDQAANRLFNVSQLMKVGQTLDAARRQETYNQIYSIKLRVKRGELSDMTNEKQQYLAFAKKVDDAIAVASNEKLAKGMTPEELQAKQQEIKKELESYLKEKPLTQNYRKEVSNLIYTPAVFSKVEQEQLKEIYLPNVLPLTVPGSVIEDIDPSKPPKGVVVQQVFDEATRKFRTIGRPKVAIA